MPDTSPPILSDWSGPAAPECCLANRSPARKSSEKLQAALESELKKRLHGLGSTIYQTAWKPHATPLGRAISRQRASAPRTSASEPSSVPSGWPTPTTRDWKDGGNPDVNVELNGLLGRVAWLAGWPTPNATDSTGAGTSGRDGGMNLQTASGHLAGWPTPKAADEQMARRSTEAAHRFMERPQKSSELGIECHQVIHNQPARFTASGEMLTGSIAGMESGGQLNPEHSRWLMGYPAEWGCCGATAMQSIRTRRRSSSKPSTPQPDLDLLMMWLLAA